MTIRLALPSEAEAVREVNADAYLPVYLPLFGQVPLPAREDFAARIARNEVWVAETQQTLAAALVLEKSDGYLLLYSIAVRPSFQRQGLSTKLLSFAEAQARMAHFPEIRLYTNEKMLRNQAIYLAAGYREIGRRPHPRLPGVALVDMAKPLD
jgi:ribosomal protein S18 acetylase RimI-like enzyme